MPATDRRLAVRVTPDAVRQIRGGHPWVFDASVTSTHPEGRAGDLAVVFDARRRFVAIGLWDPSSPIRVRILHHGRPRAIDATFWREAVAAAARRRAELAATGETTGYRVIHGENDGLPGLVVDRYGSVLVAKLYSAAWLAHLDDVVDALRSDALPAGIAPTAVVLRLARSVQAQLASGSERPLAAGRAAVADGATVWGAAPEGPVVFSEAGLRFGADVVAGQKTGWFLDQRDNRVRVRELAAGRRVLDVFSCAGGFTVNAAAGGAASVHSVDVAPPAIAAVAANLALNAGLEPVRRCVATATAADAMATLAAMADRRQRFDVVVVDPPSFASSRRQVEGALRSYGRLTELALGVLEPGGTLVQASCSSRVSVDDLAAVMHGAATRSGIRLDEVERTGHGVDHPVGFVQGAYLDAVFAVARPAR